MERNELEGLQKQWREINLKDARKACPDLPFFSENQVISFQRLGL